MEIQASKIPSEREVKEKVAKAANTMDMMSAMKLPRHARRAMAKANGIKKISGSNEPFINHAKRKRKEERAKALNG